MPATISSLSLAPFPGDTPAPQNTPVRQPVAEPPEAESDINTAPPALADPPAQVSPSARRALDFLEAADLSNQCSSTTRVLTGVLSAPQHALPQTGTLFPPILEEEAPRDCVAECYGLESADIVALVMGVALAALVTYTVVQVSRKLVLR